jgi:hypothetical protein
MVDYANMTNVASISKPGIGPRKTAKIDYQNEDPLNQEQAG